MRFLFPRLRIRSARLELYRALKGLLILSGKADHDVEADGQIRNRPPDFFEQMSEKCRIVGPAHAIQNAVIAALQRNMEMAA
jgi:hypothetical protein